MTRFKGAPIADISALIQLHWVQKDKLYPLDYGIYAFFRLFPEVISLFYQNLTHRVKEDQHL